MNDRKNLNYSSLSPPVYLVRSPISSLEPRPQVASPSLALLSLVFIASLSLAGCATEISPEEMNMNPYGDLPPGGVEGMFPGGSAGTGGVQNSQNRNEGRPSLMRIGDKVATVGRELRIQLIATDPQSDLLTYNLRSDLPDGAKFDKAIGLFTWTPVANQSGGNTLLTFEVSDGSLKDQETIAVRVNAQGAEQDFPPMIEPIGDQLLTVGQIWMYQLIGTDLNGQSIQYRVQGEIPTGFTVNQMTGLMTWTPTASDIGTFTLNAIVMDGISESATDLRLIVRDPNQATTGNQPPEFVERPPQEVTVGQMVRIVIEAMDDQPTTLQFSAQMIPDGSHFDPATQAFVWVPRAEFANRSVEAIFQVSDGEFRDFMRISFQVIEPQVACLPDPDPQGQPVTLNVGDILTNRALCREGDTDRYELTLRDSSVIDVFVEFSHQVGDIDILLYDTSMNIIALSSGTGDEERIQSPELSPGVYFLHVKLFSRGPSNYTVGFDLSTGVEQCMPDVEEALDGNNTRAQASPIGLFTENALTLCNGDVDFFSFQVNQGERIRVSTTFNTMIGDLDMKLYGPNETSGALDELWTALSATNDELIEVDSAPSSGLYILEVYLHSLGPLNYGLSVEVTAGEMCEADRFDALNSNNDQAESASTLPPELYRDLISCDDNDWYVTEIEEGRSLVAYLTYDEGIPIVTAQDINGVALSVESSYIGRVDGCNVDRMYCQQIRVTPSQDYRVFYNIRFDESAVSYDLRIRQGDESGAPCEDDLDCNLGYECLDEFDIYDFSDGMCSISCVSDGDCGSHRACVITPFGPSKCMQRCDTGLSCQSAFICEPSITTADGLTVEACMSSFYIEE